MVRSLKKGGNIIPLVLTMIVSSAIIVNSPRTATSQSSNALVESFVYAQAEIENVSPADGVKSVEPKKPPERTIYPALGSATSERVTQAVEYYQKKGITNVGVAYLVGNFASESGLRPDAIGDGGKALGIAQWHPERRRELPITLEGQMEFAWREIQGYSLKDALYGQNETLLRQSIKRYEGYSKEGLRFQYAKELLKHLNN